MRRRANRLEFTIATIGLLVLFVCSKPPQPGTAGVADRQDTGRSEAVAGADAPLKPAIESAVGAPEQTDREVLSDAPRVGAVDARSCDQLDYRNVMYGEVTVRWVWNGTKFVPQKVCVVEEDNGVSSVWSFDQQDEAVLSEVLGEPK